jgi:hypothetical protein
MGRNKHLRKLIAGQLATIAKHEHKIKGELGKEFPNLPRIRKWEKDIDIARRTMRRLEEKLER